MYYLYVWSGQFYDAQLTVQLVCDNINVSAVQYSTVSHYIIILFVIGRIVC